MLGTVPGYPAWQDLSTFGDISLECPDILVLYILDLIRAEMADLSSSSKFPFHFIRSFMSYPDRIRFIESVGHIVKPGCPNHQLPGMER